MKRSVLFLVAALLALPGCAAITIEPVDYSWSFESVLMTDAEGVVKGEPKTIVFNAAEIFQAEAGEKADVAGKQVRIIRNDAGFYFITSAGFKHVYIFKSGNMKLSLREKVLIDENGMQNPFFNRREQGVELVAGGKAYLLNKDGIVTGGKK